MTRVWPYYVSLKEVSPFLSALFMLRDSSFLENVPEDHRKLFVDGAPVAPAKLKVLKDMIRKKFSVNLHKYLSHM